MKFLRGFCAFVALTTALPIEEEVSNGLAARDLDLAKVKAAKEILGSIKKIAGSKLKGDTTSDISQPTEPVPEPVPEPAPEPTPTEAPTPTETPSPSKKTAIKEKVKSAVKAKIGVLFGKLKDAAKKKILEKWQKMKGAPEKRAEKFELAEFCENENAIAKKSGLAIAKTEEIAKRDELAKIQLESRNLLDDAMTQVFVALKRSGLINYVIRLSLTDEEVRAGVADITIELIRADVIPYSEVFNAMRESGLALDVVKYSLTDAETRQGLIDLVLELVPQLIEVCTPAVVSQADFSPLVREIPA